MGMIVHLDRTKTEVNEILEWLTSKAGKVIDIKNSKVIGEGWTAHGEADSIVFDFKDEEKGIIFSLKFL